MCLINEQMIKRLVLQIILLVLALKERQRNVFLVTAGSEGASTASELTMRFRHSYRSPTLSHTHTSLMIRLWSFMTSVRGGRWDRRERGRLPWQLKLLNLQHRTGFTSNVVGWKEPSGVGLGLKPQYVFDTSWNMSVAQSTENCQVLKSSIECLVRFLVLLFDLISSDLNKHEHFICSCTAVCV